MNAITLLLIASVTSAVLLVLVRGGVRAGVAYGVTALALPVVVAAVVCFIYLRRVTRGAGSQ